MPAHQFLRQHPELISPTSDKHWSKLPFGTKKQCDFVFREPHNDYVLVEIEKPGKQLFRKDGQQLEELTQAINKTSAGSDTSKTTSGPSKANLV